MDTIYEDHLDTIYEEHSFHTHYGCFQHNTPYIKVGDRVKCRTLNCWNMIYSPYKQAGKVISYYQNKDIEYYTVLLDNGKTKEFNKYCIILEVVDFIYSDYI